MLIWLLCADAVMCQRRVQVQSWSPQLILGPLRQAPANKHVAVLWAGALAVLPAVMGPVILLSDVFQSHDISGMTAILVVRMLLPTLARPRA